MRPPIVLAAAFGLLLSACGPPAPPPARVEQPQPAQPDREPLRRAVANIDSQLTELEGWLRVGRASDWNVQASAAQRALGNIRVDLGTLKQGGQGVGTMESCVSDLEGRLSGTRGETWDQDASYARQVLGNLRRELQNLSPGLQESRGAR